MNPALELDTANAILIPSRALYQRPRHTTDCLVLPIEENPRII